MKWNGGHISSKWNNREKITIIKKTWANQQNKTNKFSRNRIIIKTHRGRVPRRKKLKRSEGNNVIIVLKLHEMGEDNHKEASTREFGLEVEQQIFAKENLGES